MDKTKNVYRSRKRILIDNFLGGIVWSLGVWIGTTVIVGLLALFISKYDLVAAVGDFVTEVLKYIANTQSPFSGS